MGNSDRCFYTPHRRKKCRKIKLLRHFSLIKFLAGDERIELPPKVLETPIIPFDQSPKSAHANKSIISDY